MKTCGTGWFVRDSAGGPSGVSCGGQGNRRGFGEAQGVSGEVSTGRHDGMGDEEKTCMGRGFY